MSVRSISPISILCMLKECDGGQGQDCLLVVVEQTRRDDQVMDVGFNGDGGMSSMAGRCVCVYHNPVMLAVDMTFSIRCTILADCGT